MILALILPLLPAGTAFAVTAPVATTAAATSVTMTSGTLNGSITTGGEEPNVWIVWWTNNDGDKYLSFTGAPYIDRNNDFYEWLDYFENCADLGIKSAGAVSLAIGNLTQDAVYWRVVAKNSAGFSISAETHFHPTAPSARYTYYPGDVHWYTVFVSYANNDACQTFTAVGNYTLASVEIQGSGSGRLLSLDLYTVDGDHKPTGSSLASDTATTTSSAWTRFYFDTPYAVTDGVEYALVLQATVGSLDYTFYGEKIDNLYADGQFFYNKVYVVTWVTALAEWGYDADMNFKLWDSTAYPVASAHTVRLQDADITETTATLRGIVNTVWDASYTVSFEYGETTAYGGTTSTTMVYAGGTAVSKDITSLTAGTLYHYRMKSVGTLGSTTQYSNDDTFTTPDYSEEGYTIDSGLIEWTGQIPNQRKSFYAQGRNWVFFVDSNLYLSYKSSTDGITWSPAYIANGLWAVAEQNDAQASLTFDGTNVHFVSGRRDYPLSYRMGTPQASGVITWAAAGLQENIGTSAPSYLYTAPYITTDASGYPWVFVGSCTYAGDLNVEVFRSSTKDGTWTTAAGYPKSPFTALGIKYWQRGIILPFDNGDMYFIAGRRAFELSSNLFEHNGSAKLKGFKYTASTNTFSAIADITTTEMDYIGDVNDAPYALFSATSWGDYGYLVFVNTLNQMKFLEYNNQTGTWSSETTLESSLARRTAPAITVHDVDGRLYIFWIAGKSLYYKWRNTSGTWSSSPTLIVTENLMSNVANINTWEHSVEGKTAIIYRTSGNTQTGYRSDSRSTFPQMYADNNYSLKFITMSTGFSVGTDNPANVASTSATLQGHLVNDGGENCDIRFEYGLTTSYTSITTWQPGFNTGEAFNQAISGLTVNTTYHYRAIARHADLTTVYGADLSFSTTTLGAPTVTTVAATGLTNTGATLQGTITSLGDYSTVYAYFQYGLTTSYGATTTEQTQTTVTSFNQAISDLTISTTYHYRAVVRYGTSSYAYGSDATLTTTGTVTLGAPTGLMTTRSAGQIVLSWTKGSNAVNTMVRRSTTTYPSTISDGVQVYFGTGTSITDTGLTDTQGYFYSVWSEKDGSYTSTYVTAYVAPLGGTSVSILEAPNTLYIGDVKVFRNYRETNDQIIVFRYNIGYTTTPTQNVVDFFAFELYIGGTLTAKAPVKSWGHRPASIYFFPGNNLNYHQAFVLKVRGIASKWSIIPEASASVSASDWDSSLDNLDIWVWNEAEIMDSSWIAYSSSGMVLTTTGCSVFNAAIPALGSIRPRTCSLASSGAAVSTPTYGSEYEASLDTDTILGAYVADILIDSGEMLGGDSDDTSKTIALSLGCIILFIGVGALTKNVWFGMAATVPVLAFGTYADMMPFAPLMIIISILVLYAVKKLWL
jgi:hypothetical protein